MAMATRVRAPRIAPRTTPRPIKRTRPAACYIISLLYPIASRASEREAIGYSNPRHVRTMYYKYTAGRSRTLYEAAHVTLIVKWPLSYTVIFFDLVLFYFDFVFFFKFGFILI